MSSLTSYDQGRGFLRSARVGATRGVASSDQAAIKALSFAGVQCSTTAQSDMVDNFGGDASPNDGGQGFNTFDGAAVGDLGAGSVGGSGVHVAPAPAAQKKSKKKSKKSKDKSRSARW